MNPTTAATAAEDARRRIHADAAAGKILIPLAALVGAVILTRFLGEPIRRSVLIETPRAVPTAAGEAVGARQAGDSFFVRRDSVHIEIGQDIRVGEFLDLYHLRNTRGIRRALEEQARVSEDSELLRKGTPLRLYLTVPSR